MAALSQLVTKSLAQFLINLLRTNCEIFHVHWQILMYVYAYVAGRTCRYDASSLHTAFIPLKDHIRQSYTRLPCAIVLQLYVLGPLYRCSDLTNDIHQLPFYTPCMHKVFIVPK